MSPYFSGLEARESKHAEATRPGLAVQVSLADQGLEVGAGAIGAGPPEPVLYLSYAWRPTGPDRVLHEREDAKLGIREPVHYANLRRVALLSNIAF
jgi:hypothetical protein